MANQNNINPESMLRTGTVLRGTYRIDGYLSSGGFGNTYLATHVNFNEKYAIKEFFMRGVTQREDNTTGVSVSNNENVDEFNHQLEKFKKEARRLRTLNNDHIVRVHDLFDDNGTAYYVMDYIDGEDLRKRLLRTQTPLSETEVLDIMSQTIDALRAVHSQGIWHLDLKPANIMVDSTGTVKLIDFGASKQFDMQQGGVTSSAVAFTNGYAPYEQMEKSSDKFGPWTDFYALGATLYNLLTNKKPPMPSDINDDRTPDKHQALPMPASVSDKMRDVILWLMKPLRSDRPQSVDDILSFLNKQESSQTPPPLPDIEEIKNLATTTKAFNYDEPEIEEETRVGKKPEAKSEAANQQKPAVEKKPTMAKNKEPKVTKIDDKSHKKHIGNYFVYALALLLLCGLGYGFYRLTSTTGVTTEWAEGESPTTVKNESMTIPLGKCTYTGEVFMGKPNGKGIARFDKGDVCDGSFVDGNISGENIKYTVSNGDVFYGIMKNNKFSRGRYTIKEDGSYFEGTFKGNEPAKGQWYDKYGNPIDE